MSATDTSNPQEVLNAFARHIARQLESLLQYLDFNVIEVGCPIGDRIAIRHDGEWHLWRSREPMLLANALGPKHGIVDAAHAWVPTVPALSADRSRLIVAVPLIEADSPHSWREALVEFNFVEIDGDVISFDSDRHVSDLHWQQLAEFLEVQLDHAAQRDEILSVRPIHHEGHSPPSMFAWIDPGDDTEASHGYFIEVSPTADGSTRCGLVDYRHGALDRFGSALCEVVKSWNLTPFDITASSFSPLGVSFRNPADSTADPATPDV